MSVIIKDMDMPKSCAKCYLRYRDGNIWRCKCTEEQINDMLKINNGCPLESVDDLAKKIMDEINTPNRGSCDYFIVDRIEEIIKEYCEVSGE